jgi:flavin reductase (DIM6/NTAB) family NADH-FMN oxidoreductase RutF
MKIDPSDLRGSQVYRLIISCVVPRPIAWVGTRSLEGHDNLAPFSYFMGVASSPPILAFSCARADREGSLKDTARNVLETGVLTISIASEHLLDAVHATASRLGPEDSEFEHVGLTPVEGELVAAPRPAEALVSCECRLHQALDLESTHLILAEVLRFHIADHLLNEDGVVDETKLKPLARLGPHGYAGLGPILTPSTKGR